ncbi:putative DNA binding domain-containing protein [Marivirga sp. S37H4]|uniref:DNA binding domain-containing protein n=1 Tax=Marivirga aurantiaca TaxID=2802615 RepID=A0A934WYH3_9BACT|nr:ATP-binding protein [Marivirga aurantiaca]MBK6265518.1 putative DNA binding domain-containing protein [Marivirga aurantiaca]
MSESHNIEYKSTWREEYLKWICGFANANGGRLYIGIDDKGKTTGIDNHEKLLEDLPNKFRDILGVYAEVNLQSEKGKYYLEIIVPRFDVPISVRGKYYVRTGSTLQELKGPALNEFILKRTGKTWDDIPVELATLQDVDEDAIKFFAKKALKSKRIVPDATEEDTKTLLNNLHLFSNNGKLKNAALLLFGKDPQKYFTSAYFKIGRFGDSDADLKFQDVVEGNLIEMVDKVMEILERKYLIRPIRYEGMQRVEELEYPEPALREAILNAIVHKDYKGTTIQLSVYDDKLILWNPGMLPDELNIEMLKGKHPSHPRNKNIADIFFKAGYIEAWGRGISMIMDTCRKAGLPEPAIEEVAGGMQITFLKDIFSEDYFKRMGLNERQIEAVKYVKENGKITNSDYQELLGVARRTATRDLAELVEKEILKSSETRGAGAYYKF